MTTIADPERILTISEVAALAGWNRRRMFRHLTTVNRDLGGMLLRNVGTGSRPRWTVSLSALRRVAPEWFVDRDAVNVRLEELEREVRHLRRLVTETNQAVAQLVA